MPERRKNILSNEIKSYPFQLPLHALHASRNTYANYPFFQRDKVWPKRYKAELIETLIEGGYVPDVLLTRRTDGKDGYFILDGQQRIETVLQFMDALAYDVKGLPIPLSEDGTPYYYRRLSEHEQQAIRGRMMRFTELLSVDEYTLSKTFLRLQNNVSLSRAEKLWATPSKLRDVAADVHEHPFYRTVYTGRVNRRQPFQMSIYPAMIEMYQGFCDMKAERLDTLIRGKRDDLIGVNMADTINQNMTYLVRLFEGVQAQAMSELIIMYQTVWLLRFIGADLEQTPAGALADWYKQVEEQSHELKRKGFLNLFTKVTEAKVQKQMWGGTSGNRGWLDDLVYGETLVFTDALRSEAQAQRVKGWIRNDGVCPACNNPHVQLRDVNFHVFRPTDRLNTLQPACKAGAIKQTALLAV